MFKHALHMVDATIIHHEYTAWSRVFIHVWKKVVDVLKE